MIKSTCFTRNFTSFSSENPAFWECSHLQSKQNRTSGNESLSDLLSGHIGLARSFGKTLPRGMQHPAFCLLLFNNYLWNCNLCFMFCLVRGKKLSCCFLGKTQSFDLLFQMQHQYPISASFAHLVSVWLKLPPTLFVLGGFSLSYTKQACNTHTGTPAF